MDNNTPTKNYGLDWERELREQSVKDWKFGTLSVPCIAVIPEDEREAYLPVGEVQRSNRADMKDCASRAPQNILETKLNWLYTKEKLSYENRRWLENMGYVNEKAKIVLSDAFVAINSKTTRGGNSLKAPLEAIRTKGVIPNTMLPLEKSMTWDEYHDPKRITNELRELGREFAARFRIHYERVFEIHYQELLREDMIDVAGFAWPRPVNGEYPKTDGRPNHAFMILKLPKYHIFDSYIDDVDGDFIKKLASDYDLIDYGYRLFITREGEPERSGFFNWFTNLFK